MTKHIEVKTVHQGTALTTGTLALPRHHPLKTGALDDTCSGTAKIFIDHLDLGPASVVR